MKDYKLSLPVQAIPKVVPELLKAKCDHLVLLVNGSTDEAKELAVKYKDFGFDWILTTQGAEVPPKEPAKIQGTDAHLIELGEKAEYAIVVGLYKSGSPSFRYERSSAGPSIRGRHGNNGSANRVPTIAAKLRIGWSQAEAGGSPHRT